MQLVGRAMRDSPGGLHGHKLSGTAPSALLVMVVLKVCNRFPFGWLGCTCLVCTLILVAVFSIFLMSDYFACNQ